MSWARGRHRPERLSNGLRAAELLEPVGRADAPEYESAPGSERADPAELTIPVVDLLSEAPNIGEVERRASSSTLPSAQAQTFPGVALDAGRLGPYWVAAGSVAGRRHCWLGQTRQDAYAFALSEDGAAVVLVVADGLGSRSRSQIGARHLTAAVAGEIATADLTLIETTGEDVLVDAIERAQRELVDIWAPAYGISDSRLLACTLAIAVVPTDLSTSPILIARVGDSTAFSATNADTEPFSGVFPVGDGPINMVSASVPSANLRQEIEVSWVQPAGVSKLIMCTDGIADDLYESPGVRTWLARRWVQPCTERWMLESLSYSRSGSQDDRTAVVVWLDSGTGLESRAEPDDAEAAGDED